MKNLFLYVLLFSISLSRAQDTIRFKNGETKAVKVVEIGTYDIKYVRVDIPDGPNYVIEKKEVISIKYKNGQIDSFAGIAAEEQANPAVIQPKLLAAYLPEDKLTISGSKLYYHKKGVGEVRLLKMVNACTDVEKLNKMLPVVQEMKDNKKKQYLYGFIGLGVGLFSIPVGVVAGGITDDVVPFFVSISVGSAVGITGAVLSGIYKNKRTAKKIEVARIYNGDK